MISSRRSLFRLCAAVPAAVAVSRLPVPAPPSPALVTLEEIAAEQGLTWEEVRRQREYEVAQINRGFLTLSQVAEARP